MSFESAHKNLFTWIPVNCTGTEVSVQVLGSFLSVSGFHGHTHSKDQYQLGHHHTGCGEVDSDHCNDCFGVAAVAKSTNGGCCCGEHELYLQ